MTTWLSVKQVLANLNHAIGKTLIYQLASDNKIRSTRLGGKLLIDWESVEAHLNANEKRSEPTKPTPPVKMPPTRPGTKLTLW